MLLFPDYVTISSDYSSGTYHWCDLTIAVIPAWYQSRVPAVTMTTHGPWWTPFSFLSFSNGCKHLATGALETREKFRRSLASLASAGEPVVDRSSYAYTTYKFLLWRYDALNFRIVNFPREFGIFDAVLFFDSSTNVRHHFSMKTLCKTQLSADALSLFFALHSYKTVAYLEYTKRHCEIDVNPK